MSLTPLHALRPRIPLDTARPSAHDARRASKEHRRFTLNSLPPAPGGDGFPPFAGTLWHQSGGTFFCPMSGYVKLFSEIIESSIWDEDSETCKVWITLLALADSEGFVRGSPGWLAKRSRVNVDKVDSALKKFTSPDKFSRTPTEEGKRIEATPDGWVILNYVFYREHNGLELSKDPRRTYQREWMRKKREKEKVSTDCQQVSTDVNGCKPSASASASENGGTGKKPENSNPTPLTSSERVTLDKSLGRAIERLDYLRKRGPYGKNEPQLAEIQQLKEIIPGLREKLGIQI